MKQIPTIQRLRERLSYEPLTGRLFWKDAQDLPKKWNTRYAGKEAAASLSRAGYRQACVDGVVMSAHRVAWAIHYGEWPKHDIDHINGVRSDNRISNMRDISHKQNQRNMCIARNNKSGVMGVNFHKRDKRWRAFIEVDGKSIHLGNYKNKEDAVKARLVAEQEYGFMPEHGKLAA